MSGPEIDYNELYEDGLVSAYHQLLSAAEVYKGLFNLDDFPKEILRNNPKSVRVIARLAHQNAQAEDRRIMREAELETLSRIADGIEMISGSLMQLIVGELKERWLKSHQNYTEAELKEAMDYFDSMAIAASGLKLNDK